jgi:amino acid adenylation domain-containing protein
MRLVKKISDSILRNNGLNAFLIEGEYYPYGYLAERISAIRNAVREISQPAEKRIALIANDDIDTYASIFALWLEGRAYVPVGPSIPLERSNMILYASGTATVLDSTGRFSRQGFNVVNTGRLPSAGINLTPQGTGDQEEAFVLFTSGTTGTPKGVPISMNNLNSFVDAFFKEGYRIGSGDRFLQMFDITFDLSVMSYLIPVLTGACVYTVSDKKIKFNQIYDLMEEHRITIALMVPSILNFFRPYFDEISFPDLRYSLFCGEALSLDIVTEWSRCIPGAEIFNVYGPTEDTIFCSVYRYSRDGFNKHYNGILSIGKPMHDTTMIITGENNDLLGQGSMGEICLGGRQLTRGYLNNNEKNRISFFKHGKPGCEEIFYRSGDLGYFDEDGDFMFAGRKDHQVKIQGYRVELAEIEYYARKYAGSMNIVATDYISEIGSTELGMAIESVPYDTTHLKEWLARCYLPIWYQRR